MFPGAGATIDYNEAGEPTGWDSGYGFEPEYRDPYDDVVYDGGDEEECDGCDEPLSGEVGEFHDPNDLEAYGVHHVSCRPDGWVVS